MLCSLTLAIGFAVARPDDLPKRVRQPTWLLERVFFSGFERAKAKRKHRL